MNFSKVLFLLVFVITQSFADDTDVFVGNGGGTTPNVMLIVDTSRSMASFVNPSEDYDPNKVYDNSRYGFDPDGDYAYKEDFTKGSPKADLFKSKSIYLDPTIAADIAKYKVASSSIHCSEPDFETKYKSQGYYEDKWVFWRPGKADNDPDNPYDASPLGWSGPWYGYTLDEYIFIGNTLSKYRPDVDDNPDHILQCYRGDTAASGSSPYEYQGAFYKYISYEKGNMPYGNNYYKQHPISTFHYTFLMSGNYLNYLSIVSESRMDVARRAVSAIAEKMSGINLGLMRFDSLNDGGYVDVAVKPIETYKDQIVNQVAGYRAHLGTPISEVLYESYLYFSGDKQKYGNNSYFSNIWNVKTRYNKYCCSASVGYGDDGDLLTYNYDYNLTSGDEDAWKDSTHKIYKAPETLSCTASKVMLFSDGEPTFDVGANSEIGKLFKSLDVPTSELNQYLDSDGKTFLSKSCYGDGGCAEELAYYMANADHRKDVVGIQNIKVDTLGGFVDNNPDAVEALQNIAKAGGGEYYAASDFDGIVAQLETSFKKIITDDSTFISPTVAVNSFNSLELTDEVYYTVFQPSSTSAWSGNLKRYKVDDDGNIVADIGVLTDPTQEVDPNVDIDIIPNTYKEGLAIDPDSGFFKLESRSYWGDRADGYFVKKGGMANHLTEERNIYTTSASGSSLSKVSMSLPSDDILAPDNAHATAAKTQITRDLLGLDASFTDDQYTQLVEWVAGIKRSLEARSSSDSTLVTKLVARKELEDPLHSQPLIINYAEGKRALFMGTNSGYLHAFNIELDTPGEIFSFIPKELLTNPKYYFGAVEKGSKVYGMDGQLSYWHEDLNANRIVDGNDKVYLYAGMRRGGSSYYALDVTDVNHPKLAWQINGAYQNADKNIPTVTSGFEDLGQTWSKMIPVDIKWQGKKKTVLFFTGGYDAAADATTKRKNNQYGTNLYMVDPKDNGKLLWSAKANTSLDGNMNYSFVTSPVVIDRDGNGYSDLVYTADIGGQIWRFDLNEATLSANDFATGGVIADVNDGSETGDRRFFNTPDISYIKDNSAPYVLVSIGSGNRAKPLETKVINYQFLIKDNIGKEIPTSYSAIGMSDLVKWQSSNTSSSVPNGWYVSLTNTGEKLLSSSRILRGEVYFSSYAPVNDEASQVCGGDTGAARLYQLNIYTPGLVNVKTLDSAFIPGEITFILTDGSDSGSGPSPDPDCKLDNSCTCEQLGTCQRTCEDSKISIITNTDTTASGMSSCSLIQKNYWKENIQR